MKLLPALFNEVSINLVSAAAHSCFVGFVGDFVADCLFLVLREKVGNLSSVEQVVDIFEEVLTDNLAVRE